MLTDSGDGDAVHFVYRVEGTNGPVFVNYDSELLTELNNGYVSPDRVYLGPTLTAPQSLMTLEREGQTVEWGIWNASTADPATLLESSTSLTEATLDTTPFFYVFAEPADLTSLTGTRNLDLCSSMDCINVSASSGLALSSASGSMEVKLDSLAASGNLFLTMEDNSWWDLYFTGTIQNNSLLAANDLTAIDVEQQFVNESAYFLPTEEKFADITGEFQGLFIHSEGQGLEFVGGFGVSSNEANESISGVFLMSEFGSEEDTTPP